MELRTVKPRNTKSVRHRSSKPPGHFLCKSNTITFLPAYLTVRTVVCSQRFSMVPIVTRTRVPLDSSEPLLRPGHEFCSDFVLVTIPIIGSRCAVFLRLKNVITCLTGTLVDSGQASQACPALFERLINTRNTLMHARLAGFH